MCLFLPPFLLSSVFWAAALNVITMVGYTLADSLRVALSAAPVQDTNAFFLALAVLTLMDSYAYLAARGVAEVASPQARASWWGEYLNVAASWAYLLTAVLVYVQKLEIAIFFFTLSVNMLAVVLYTLSGAFYWWGWHLQRVAELTAAADSGEMSSSGGVNACTDALVGGARIGTAAASATAVDAPLDGKGDAPTALATSRGAAATPHAVVAPSSSGCATSRFSCGCDAPFPFLREPAPFTFAQYASSLDFVSYSLNAAAPCFYIAGAAVALVVFATSLASDGVNVAFDSGLIFMSKISNAGNVMWLGSAVCDTATWWFGYNSGGAEATGAGVTASADGAGPAPGGGGSDGSTDSTAACAAVAIE